jgi:nucleoside phosphorylase
VLKALPAARHALGWDVPTWHTDKLLIVESGMGSEKTAAVLPRLDTLSVEALWLFGWCGGLSPELDVGDLVLAEATVPLDAPEAHIDHRPPDALHKHLRRLAGELNLRLVVGPVLTSDRVLASVADKRAGAAMGAVAVEMEAGPLARWAAAHSVPFFHLRVVLDPVASVLPKTRLPTDKQRRRPAHVLLWHALTHPCQWSVFWRLFQQVGTTQRTMTRVIAALAEPGNPLGTRG